MADVTFEVRARTDSEFGGTMLIGTAAPGLVGVTVADHIVRQMDAEQVGHVRVNGLPDVTPFTDGEPRHGIRLYALPETNVTVLVGEVFLPVLAGEQFVDAVVEWATGVGIWEAVVPYAVPYQHGPDDHDAFYVATPAFRDRRIGDRDLRPLPGGFLDGMVGELLTAGLDRDAPVGTLVTPAHPPGPDLEAAVRLLGPIADLYDLPVDVEELTQRAERQRQYYAELADRVQSLENQSEDGRYPQDRMFM
jgi:uncharacterized protein